MKHLPKSAQIEYEYLINKMNKLEKENLQKNQQKLLKTKDTAIPKTVPTACIYSVPVPNNSSNAVPTLHKLKSITTLMSPLNSKRLRENSPTKVKVPGTKDSLTKCLDKISSLSQDGQNRMMEKSELNYRNHR